MYSVNEAEGRPILALQTMTNETEQYCAAIHPLLPAFSIGATDPDETALVQKHLAACPQAVAELASYQMLAEALLFSAPPVEAPAGLADRIRAATGAPTGASSRALPQPSTVREWFLAAACAKPCHLLSFVRHWRSARWHSLRFWPLASILMLK